MTSHVYALNTAHEVLGGFTNDNQARRFCECLIAEGVVARTETGRDGLTVIYDRSVASQVVLHGEFSRYHVAAAKSRIWELRSQKVGYCMRHLGIEALDLYTGE